MKVFKKKFGTRQSTRQKKSSFIVQTPLNNKSIMDKILIEKNPQEETNARCMSCMATNVRRNHQSSTRNRNYLKSISPSIDKLNNDIKSDDNVIMSLISKPSSFELNLCTSPHFGVQMLHTKILVTVDTLYNMLFSNSSNFLREFHSLRQSTELKMGEWSMNTEGESARVVNVTLKLLPNVGPKTSKVTEYQTLRGCSRPGHLYSIDVKSHNAGIPYADSFFVLVHYCLVRTIDNYTDLLIFARVEFLKSVWAVVKTFIENNTYAGLENFFQALQAALQNNKSSALARATRARSVKK